MDMVDVVTETETIGCETSSLRGRPEPRPKSREETLVAAPRFSLVL